MAKIIIFEDEELIFKELDRLFNSRGYVVIDGLKGGNIEKDFDVALVDVGLPGVSGYEICRTIRKTKTCPVVFLTAMSEAQSELEGFAAGGDDYIHKPFNTEILLARVERHLKNTVKENITIGKLTLDTVKCAALYDGKSVVLTKTEFAILKILAEAEGDVGKKKIITRLWDNEAYVDENSLYVNINRLRQKLAEIGLPEMIVNVRGVGYRLER